MRGKPFTPLPVFTQAEDEILLNILRRVEVVFTTRTDEALERMVRLRRGPDPRNTRL